MVLSVHLKQKNLSFFTVMWREGGGRVHGEVYHNHYVRKGVEADPDTTPWPDRQLTQEM